MPNIIEHDEELYQLLREIKGELLGYQLPSPYDIRSLDFINAEYDVEALERVRKFIAQYLENKPGTERTLRAYILYVFQSQIGPKLLLEMIQPDPTIINDFLATKTTIVMELCKDFDRAYTRLRDTKRAYSQENYYNSLRELATMISILLQHGADVSIKSESHSEPSSSLSGHCLLGLNVVENIIKKLRCNNYNRINSDSKNEALKDFAYDFLGIFTLLINPLTSEELAALKAFVDTERAAALEFLNDPNIVGSKINAQRFLTIVDDYNVAIDRVKLAKDFELSKSPTPSANSDLLMAALEEQMRVFQLKASAPNILHQYQPNQNHEAAEEEEEQQQDQRHHSKRVRKMERLQ